MNKKPIQNLIPDKDETIKMLDKVRLGQPVDNVLVLRGVIQMGALASGMTKQQALQMACTPELDKFKVNFKVKFSNG